MSELRRAADAHRATRDRLEREIRKAKDDGASLRTIAEEVGWSHEQVRKIVLRR